MTPYRLPILFCLLLLATIARGNDFFITLKNEKITVPGFNYRVADILDAREQTYCIGIVQRGVGNKKTAAFFQDSMKVEFGYLLANSFAPDASAKSVVLQINRLQVYEITSSNREVGIVEFKRIPNSTPVSS